MNEKQKAAMQQALEALRAYGAHAHNCDFLILLTSNPPQRKPCSCGLASSMKSIEAALAAPEQCECHRCIDEKKLTANGLPLSLAKMILCPTCGNKRCPHASDHRLACTGSNEPGQPGSVYTTPPARQPLTDDQRGGLVMEHLGPAALTGGTMSVYEAFLAGLSAAERAHRIGGNDE